MPNTFTKIIGYPLFGISLLFVYFLGESLNVASLLLSAIAFMFYIGACYLIWGKKKMKIVFWHRVRIFLCSGLVIPAILGVIAAITYYKDHLHRTSSTIYLDTSINGSVSSNIAGIAYITLLISSCYLMMVGFKKESARKYVFPISLVALLTLLGVGYYTKDDYQAVEKSGLVFSDQGHVKHYPWKDFEQAELLGYIKESRSGRSRTINFEWAFSLQHKNIPEPFTFTFTYSKNSISDSLAIKKEVKQHLALPTHSLTHEDLEYLERPMGDEGVEWKRKFYELFDCAN
ncbi:hypothetical protein A374_01189 [Fictibacillus macauensis ZFHKF-1]|uniref:Uncharacterized protein n=1 Tax=Fictibacillus macauensis ZFHKF-1 TaxID=1196324 RepID=I8UK43_9BACL|nr:hypothetical protein [Fictibacillus macauensis]EIT87255.1 hypothetical protein A374_01189 [Fictibacillus macauensis ZFHKF-1]